MENLQALPAQHDNMLIDRLDRLIELLEQQQQPAPQSLMQIQDPSQAQYNINELKIKPFLERPEAAFLLRVSVGHLDNIIRSGELAVTRVGRRVLIKNELLNQWLDEQDGSRKAVGA